MELYSSTTAKSLFCKHNFLDFYGIIIHSNNNFVAKETARKHAFLRLPPDTKKKTIEQEFTTRGTKSTITYTQSCNVIELDANMYNSQLSDKFLITDFIKDIVQQKNINFDKHVIIIHNIDIFTIASLNALKKIMETYYENVYFIFTCKKLSSTLQSVLVSSCYIVKNYINVRDLCQDFIHHYFKVDFSDIQNVKRLECVIEKGNYDIINVILLWNVPYIEMFRGNLTVFLEKLLLMILEQPTQNNTERFVLDLEIRNICIKLGAACIPLSQIAKHVIRFTVYRKPSCIYEIVKLSAEIESIVKISNKELFVFEDYFHKISHIFWEI